MSLKNLFRARAAPARGLVFVEEAVRNGQGDPGTGQPSPKGFGAPRIAIQAARSDNRRLASSAIVSGVAPDQSHLAAVRRLATLRRFAHDQSRHVERRRLLLDAAGIGDDQVGLRQQMDELAVARGRHRKDSRVGADLLAHGVGDFGVRVNRDDHTDIGMTVNDAAQSRAQPVDAGAPGSRRCIVATINRPSSSGRPSNGVSASVRDWARTCCKASTTGLPVSVTRQDGRPRGPARRGRRRSARNGRSRRCRSAGGSSPPARD